MWETTEEIELLQALLDRSMAESGCHLRGIITAERRLSAADLCAALTGMRLLTVATVTAAGRPMAAPVDGYFIHGEWHFSTSRDAVRAGHLRQRPSVSATHVPDEQLAISVHGQAEVYDINDAARPQLRQAMLEHYLPLQGDDFQAWLDEDGDIIGVRIAADKMFTFHLPADTAP